MIKYFIFIFIVTGLLNSSEIEMKNHKFFANGFNVIVETKIDNVSEARVFFKDHKSPNYELYVKMKCINRNCYAKLPLSKIDLLSFDYIVVYKDFDGVLNTSETYTTTKRDLLIVPSWQKKYYEEKVELYSELKDIPKYVRGIGNNLVVNPTKKTDIWGDELNFYSKPKKGNTNCLTNLWNNLLVCLNLESNDILNDNSYLIESKKD